MFSYLKKFVEFNDNPSSKRLIGVLSALALVLYMFIYPSDGANNSVLILALSGLGMSSLEKLIRPKQ